LKKKIQNVVQKKQKKTQLQKNIRECHFRIGTVEAVPSPFQKQK